MKLAVLLLLLFPNVANAFFRCLFQPTPRCGFLNLGLTVHIGEGQACAEKCSYVVTSPYTCGICPTVVDKYDIELSFGSSVPEGDQSFFTTAKARWESIVTKGLPSIVVGDQPAIEGCEYPVTIDDLFVCVTYSTFDGANGTVGGGRRTLLRTAGSRLPAAGVVTLDVADISFLKDRGIFDDIILRSMGRAVGKMYLLFMRKNG
jgi:hypothetical protein